MENLAEVRPRPVPVVNPNMFFVPLHTTAPDLLFRGWETGLVDRSAGLKDKGHCYISGRGGPLGVVYPYFMSGDRIMVEIAPGDIRELKAEEDGITVQPVVQVSRNK